MGAKQSKRSVDISGKEAESAGEVAAAGAGGEGRVEPIADADALKPQLNGDAHIQPPQEISDKEKQLDSGTPENEKDATTEKEGKEEQNEEKETTPVTNGDSEPKEENGETVPTPEDGKKPKKEKVKKKWSLRSISFSRKDKPKQEKKPKEEEQKTNGEPEKVPEEAAEATAEPVENKTAEVAQADAETKEKTPETPVTEPMTNGSSTPESPKVETIATDDAPEPAAAPAPQEPAAPELKPEQLPLNGLSLDEKKEAPEDTPVEESKAEEPTVVATETAPAPENPVRTEVCDAQMPLIEPTPPPLPANPPPSSVASFAATTMAPELVEASLANTAENAILTPPAIPDVTADKPVENNDDTQTVITNLDVTELSPPLKEIVSEDTPVAAATTETDVTQTNTESVTSNNISESIVPEIGNKIESEPETVPIVSYNETKKKEHVEEIIETTPVENTETKEIENQITDLAEASAGGNINGNDSVETESPAADNINALQKDVSIDSSTDIDLIPEPEAELPVAGDDLPPPPPEDEPILDNSETVLKDIANDNSIVDMNGVVDETELKNLKNKKDALGNIVEVHECNGNGDFAVSPPSSPAEPPAPDSETEALPPPPLDEPLVQDPLPIADKIADLIPEIPTVPELKTETEAASDMAVAVAD